MYRCARLTAGRTGSQWRAALQWRRWARGWFTRGAGTLWLWWVAVARRPKTIRTWDWWLVWVICTSLSRTLFSFSFSFSFFLSLALALSLSSTPPFHYMLTCVSCTIPMTAHTRAHTTKARRLHLAKQRRRWYLDRRDWWRSNHGSWSSQLVRGRLLHQLDGPRHHDEDVGVRLLENLTRAHAHVHARAHTQRWWEGDVIFVIVCCI